MIEDVGFGLENDVMPGPEEYTEASVRTGFVKKESREYNCDSLTEGRKLLQDWADVYYERHQVKLNLSTLRKRRIEARVGMHVPPHAWYLTWEEFLEVVNTPLAYCNRVLKM